jgi:hypothetical protein
MEASEYDPLQRTLYLALTEVGDQEIEKSGVSASLDLAELDRERYEADRLVRRGYDVDDTAPSHAEFIARQRPANGDDR